jgi:hypothetical protein
VEKLEKTAKEIRDNYKETEVFIVKPDISVKEHVKSLFEQVRAEFGRGADVLLANALVAELVSLAMQRISEFVHISMLPLILQPNPTNISKSEYPNLRVFTTAPGLPMTSMTLEEMKPFSADEGELVGMLALYLSQPKADILRGSFVSVNLDVEEMEAKREEIVEKKLLKIAWMPVLPISRGKGLT